MKSTKRVVFPLLVYTPPFFKTGVDVNRNIMAAELAEKGYSVLCVGVYQEEDKIEEVLTRHKIAFQVLQGTIISYSYKGVPCVMVKENDFFSYLKGEINQDDIVFIINRKSAEILKIVKENKALSVALVSDAILERREMYAKQPDYILYESESVAAFGTQFHNLPYHLFPPPFVAPPNVVVPKKFKNRITLINPIPQKGGDVFFALAEDMPEHFFFAVEGWNPIYVEKKYTDKNVRYFNRQQAKSMSFIFQETGVLISPSHFNEAFGRTIVEAGLHGIPSVVSNKGALPQVVGGGGIVLDTYDVEEWKKAIETIESDYENYSRKAYENAQLYLLDTEEKLKKIGIL
jgi:glycosyltransferase involved in cell wall biosynthesis